MLQRFQDTQFQSILNFVRAYGYWFALCSIVLLSGSIVITNLISAKSVKTWGVHEVPIAFWTWQTDVPTSTELERATGQLQIQRLFIRAGQIDFANGVLRRIRPTKGKIPSGIEIHFVYNATPDLLRSFEKLGPQAVADIIADTYLQDFTRAAAGGGRVTGIQLDLDIPTRLLGKYATVLQLLRKRLPAGVGLSITGLPTWMNSPQLPKTLAVVDFWIPQCYGAKIPERTEQDITISSPADISQTIRQVRKLGRPFYAGLAAYGYAIHYRRNGGILGLRGDLDPRVVVTNPYLELMDHSVESNQSSAASGERRYRYRALEDCSVDGIELRKGESLVLDVDTAKGLRASARAVREEAGSLLCGICLFRLPTNGDQTVMSLEEITAAISDRPSINSANIQISKVSSNRGGNEIRVSVKNNGSTSALLGSATIDSMTVDLQVPSGSISEIKLDGFSKAEPLCAVSSSNSGADASQPCSIRRANIIRLAAASWRPGDIDAATVIFTKGPPSTISLKIATLNDDGTAWQQQRTLEIEKGIQQ